MGWNRPYERSMSGVIDLQKDNWGRGPGECLGTVGNDMYEAFEVAYRSFGSAEAAGAAASLGDYPGRPAYLFANLGQGPEVAHIMFGTPEYLIQCWRGVPNFINDDHSQFIGYADYGYMSQRMAIDGWAVTFGGNIDLGIINDLGSSTPGTPGTNVPSIWVPGMTDYKGQMGPQELFGAKWFNVVTPWTPQNSLYNVIDAAGISAEQALIWTQAWASSKYANQGDGGGFVTREQLQSGNYFAGQRLALSDVVAAFAQHDAAIQLQLQNDAKAANDLLAKENAALVVPEPPIVEVPVVTSPSDEVEIVVPIVQEPVKPQVPIMDTLSEDIQKAVTKAIKEARVDNTPLPTLGFWKTVGTKEFWGDLSQRALNTFLQVGMAAVGTGAVGITELDYNAALNLGATGALISVVTTFVRASGSK